MPAKPAKALPSTPDSGNDHAASLGDWGPAAIRARAYIRLAQSIMEMIKAGAIMDGRLPPERILAQRFGVSRTAVRDALIALQIHGIVEIRGGSGVYLCDSAPITPAREVAREPFELLDARQAVEPEVAAIAATRANDCDLDRIAAALHECRHALEGNKETERVDREFHMAIAAASGNSLLQTIVEDLWDTGPRAAWQHLKEASQTKAFRDAAMEEHLAVFEALVAREPAAARRAMRAHIQRVTRDLRKAHTDSILRGVVDQSPLVGSPTGSNG